MHSVMKFAFQQKYFLSSWWIYPVNNSYVAIPVPLRGRNASIEFMKQAIFESFD
jgi:hypothetical protein